MTPKRDTRRSHGGEVAPPFNTDNIKTTIFDTKKKNDTKHTDNENTEKQNPKKSRRKQTRKP